MKNEQTFSLFLFISKNKMFKLFGAATLNQYKKSLKRGKLLYETPGNSTQGGIIIIKQVLGVQQIRIEIEEIKMKTLPP